MRGLSAAARSVVKRPNVHVPAVCAQARSLRSTCCARKGYARASQGARHLCFPIRVFQGSRCHARVACSMRPGAHSQTTATDVPLPRHAHAHARAHARAVFLSACCVSVSLILSFCLSVCPLPRPSPLLSVSEFQVVELTRVFRQVDGPFVEQLTKIRNGQVDTDVLRFFAPRQVAQTSSRVFPCA